LRIEFGGNARQRAAMRGSATLTMVTSSWTMMKAKLQAGKTSGDGGVVAVFMSPL
jgi:hypothetical protein